MTDKVDVSKIRVGDEVTIRAVVSHVGRASEPYNPGISVGVGGEHAFVRLQQIVTHIPGPLVLGDVVRRHGQQGTGIVVGISDGLAWIKWHNIDSHTVHRVDDMERVS